MMNFVILWFKRFWFQSWITSTTITKSDKTPLKKKQKVTTTPTYPEAQAVKKVRGRKRGKKSNNRTRSSEKKRKVTSMNANNWQCSKYTG